MKSLKGCVLGTLLLVTLGASPSHGRMTAIVTPSEASNVVTVVDTTTRQGTVSGKLVNASPRPVRDVKLAVRHQWRWNDERHPGTDNPGRAEFYTVSDEIPPGGTVPFTYRNSPPLPVRTDGHFTSSVEVVAFTEVGS